MLIKAFKQENILAIDKEGVSSRILSFLQTQLQNVEVIEQPKYYIICGTPANLFLFLCNMAEQFGVELIA